MKPLVESKDYEKSIYKMFGMFPFLLLLVACIIAYIVGVFMTFNSEGTVANYLEPQLLADAFFRGTIGTVVLFYIARLSSIKASEKSKNLMDLEEAGHYITCMSHSKWSELSLGNLIITQRRFYFQPDRQMDMALAFDFKDYKGFTIELGEPMKSVGLFLMTNKKQMVEIKNASGALVGTFIMPEAEKHIEMIRAQMQE